MLGALQLNERVLGEVRLMGLSNATGWGGGVGLLAHGFGQHYACWLTRSAIMLASPPGGT